MKISDCKVTLIDSMGTDLSVVNAARVSFDKESQFMYDDDDPTVEYLDNKDVKLIKYLYTHNHWTPFAHTCLSFRIKAPIFVARQLGKHQVGLVWNEVSRRYVDSEPEFFFPKEWRGKPLNSKQGSSGKFDVNQPEYNLDVWFTSYCALTVENYKELIKNGLCPEQARMILPQNMMTEWIWTGSLFAFIRVCKLRLDPHTQKETQDVVQDIADVIAQKFPETWGVVMSTV
jgi:thymidylate synthase (FAD)